MLIMLIQCNTDQKSVNINFDRASVVSGCQGGVHTKMQEKQIWLGLSHLSEHRFNHNFNNSINFLCTCSLDIKSAVHYFLHFSYYNSTRTSPLNDLNSVDRTLLNLSDLSLVNVLLYGGPQFDVSQNYLFFNF